MASATARPSRPALLEPLEPRSLLAADAVIEWNDVLLDAVRVARTAPPYAARNMAMVHVAVDDAVDAALAKRGKGQANTALEAAVARAAFDVLLSIYPDQRAALRAALNETLAAIPDGPGENRGLAAGRAAAHRILADRRHDGADELVTYVPPTGPGMWQPTPPGLAPAVLPNWPAVTPFALKTADQFRPAPPPPITSVEYAADFNEVKSLGAKDSTTRTPEQTQIALFWADGAGTATPPGHWNEIAQHLALDQGNTLAENAQMFRLLNVALADAGIASWDAKYAYHCLRPITAIHNAAADGNDLTEADVNWTPLIATPPFPSYVSGHSTFSAAAATVLAGFFGTDQVTFTTTSEGLPGVTRTFTSLSAAAAEAGQSRIYGGIHFQFDNTDGLALGRAVGEYVLTHVEHAADD